MDAIYQHIVKGILKDLGRGKLAVGSLLPTRTEIAGKYQVARATVDRAIAHLIERGILESNRRGGTRVVRSMPARRIALVHGGATGTGIADAAGVTSPDFAIDWVPTALTDLGHPADRSALATCDGVLWLFPEAREIGWARELGSDLPQVILNREVDDLDFVSFDHRGAVREITSRRLALAPGALPIFLGRQDDGLVWGLREQGFIEACAEAKRFYRIERLPEGFDEKVRILGDLAASAKGQPLLFVSGSLQHTGAFMRWFHQTERRWGDGMRYSDFDNDLPAHVFGTPVTTFLQDWSDLIRQGVAALAKKWQGDTETRHALIMPRFVQGET